MDRHFDLGGQTLHLCRCGKRVTPSACAFEQTGTAVSRQTANRILDARERLGQIPSGKRS
jgi:hypothetical protein